MIFKEISGTETHIIFTDEEIDILKKNKKIILKDNHLKTFINELAKIATHLQVKLYEADKEMANQQSSEGTEIKLK
jgi:regulator of replication initiation timing